MTNKMADYKISIIIVVIIIIGVAVGLAVALSGKKDDNPAVSEEKTSLLNITFIDYDSNGTTHKWTDIMKETIITAANNWSNIITALPGNDSERKLNINLSLNDMQEGVLASASITNSATDTDTDIKYSTAGNIKYAVGYYDNKWNIQSVDTDSLFYRVFNHEVGHIFGIGTLWGAPNNLTNDGTGVNDLYTGTNALSIYQYYNADGEDLYIDGVNTNYKNTSYPNVGQCIGIPIEDHGGGGTAGGHPEEGDAIISGDTSNNDRSIDGVSYPGLGDELMTGQSESAGTPMPLSAITLGFLKDLGYEVNYANAEPYILGTGADV